MTNLESILKSRDVTLPTKVLLVKAMVSSSHIWMWQCTMKKAEHLIIDSVELWCWRTLETPLDWKEIQPVNPKGNQSPIFIGRTDAEAETPALATWCEELTQRKRPWCWERLKAGGKGDDRGGDRWMASPTWWTWVSSGSWWWTGKPGVLQSMGLHRVRHNWVTELNWYLLHSYEKFTIEISV